VTVPPETPHPWLDAGTVAAWLKVDPGHELLETVRTAAADYVEGTRRDLWVIELDAEGVEISRTYVATPRVVEAALIAAARLWTRKDSAAGLASYGEFGASEILRIDPDVERLLAVGRYAFPRIG
jgi:hypothetical protein